MRADPNGAKVNGPGTPVRSVRDDRPVGKLFTEVGAETSRLLRQEIALARAEIGAALSAMASGAGLMAAGGLTLFSGFLVLLAAAVLALAQAIPYWAASLVVGGVVSITGVILLLVGRLQMRTKSLVPEKTLRTLRDDATWAREQMR
jgi:uncharacterized membrane protein YgdD (TMEM256/DUF423 family)